MSTSISNGNSNNNDSQDVIGSFRQKANFMRAWKPGSVPSNRDKLELYALHKQSISGDAPSMLSTHSAAERAKYQAWRSKSGVSSMEAMKLYLQESDRQLRVYGTASSAATSNGSATNLLAAQQQQPTSISTTTAPGNNGTNDDANNDADQSKQQQQQQPRGLAAIPLLCAAASESRQAYLRRLANTRLEQAWWARQEPLTATPGSLFAVPESILIIGLAATVERISLTAEHVMILQMVPVDVWRSLLWPLHNSLLSIWMAYILVATEWTAAMDILQTIVWGSRSTGWSLEVIWKEQVLWCAQSVGTLTEPHQPLTARLMGLGLWPYALLVSVSNAIFLPVMGGYILWKTILYTLFLLMTWWYWWIVLPWFAGALLFLSIPAGYCFAIIELAGA